MVSYIPSNEAFISLGPLRSTGLYLHALSLYASLKKMSCNKSTKRVHADKGTDKSRLQQLSSVIASVTSGLLSHVSTAVFS